MLSKMMMQMLRHLNLLKMNLNEKTLRRQGRFSTQPFFINISSIENRNTKKVTLNSHEPKVAVLHCCYNDFSEETLQSILNLSYKKKEIFILDELTDDIIRKKVDRFAEKHDIKIFQKIRLLCSSYQLKCSPLRNITKTCFRSHSKQTLYLKLYPYFLKIILFKSVYQLNCMKRPNSRIQNEIVNCLNLKRCILKLPQSLQNN